MKLSVRLVFAGTLAVSALAWRAAPAAPSQAATRDASPRLRIARAIRAAFAFGAARVCASRYSEKATIARW